MKLLITDIFAVLERFVRAGFYLGAGLYLGIKALLVIPNNPGLPDWMAIPAFLVAIIGGMSLWVRVFREPLPWELRRWEKDAAINSRILAQTGKRALDGE